MEPSSLFILPLFSLLLVLLLDVPHAHSHSFNSTTHPPKCHQEERNYLLEFKATFYNNESCIPSGPGLETWTIEDKNGDCCNWSRVKCDELSGHVIGLELEDSCLYGSINSSSSIFKLTHMQTLKLSLNDFRHSKIPSAISNLSRLETLDLYGSNFSGQIPSEILNLTNLSVLELSWHKIYPKRNQLTLNDPSLRDLVQSLLKLKQLDLSDVEISSSLPDSLSRLTSLQHLFFFNCKLQGQVPPSVVNLTNLVQLDLSHNQFTGEIFSYLVKLTNLELFSVSFNNFSGQIPRTISHLKNLTFLYLDSNNFSWKKTHLDMFFQLPSLFALDLSYNDLSFVIDTNSIEPRPKLGSLNLASLNLASCNLRSFPLVLQGLDSLSRLDLSTNNISGEVPQWFMDVCMENIWFLNISNNHLFGSLPIPLTNPFLQYYFVSNNEFSGELPTRMCNLVNLGIFDIANNNLSGMLPQCLANLVGVSNLSVLNLHNNNFSGPIPHVGKTLCNLRMIDMSYNQLEGLVPRDMKNCPNLEFLNLGNNKINDVFPFWLGKLPTLSILILRSNGFHGIIGKPFGGYKFPKLQVINLFNNNFSGYLPAQYFESWVAMKDDAHKEDQTMSYATYGTNIFRDYFYAVVIANKGVNLAYDKIPQSLTGVDLSSNHFIGEIPKSIATLKGLHFLNLSKNVLIGSIPLNLSGLTNLESLDLSHNNLSGEIPQQLTDITTLEFFDVSFNQLTGRIPQSKQFNTFGSTSYQGNLGLCGFPLSKKCKHEAPPLPSLEKGHASRTWIEINWKIISMGYSSGFVIGVVMGMNWTRGFKRIKRVRHIRFILN